MKKNFILIALLSLMCLSGCDFFRKVAGRPTSADIQDRKELIAVAEKEKAEAAIEKARQDSLLAVRKAEEEAARLAEQDSLAACDYLRSVKCMMYDLKGLKGLSSGHLDHRYYIVVGSFGDASNADKFVARLAADPALEPVKMRFRTGMIAVGVCPRDKIKDVRTSFEEVRTQKFCPKDAWILVNEQ